MITEEYLRGSYLFRRLKNGPNGQIVELYAARLVKEEFAAATTRRHLKLVADLYRRRQARFTPSDRLLEFLEAL